MSSTIKRPCDAACPKCGSLIVTKHYRISGDVVRTHLEDNTEFDTAIATEDFPSADEYHNKVVKETIACFCTTCRFHFNVAPLQASITL